MLSVARLISRPVRADPAATPRAHPSAPAAWKGTQFEFGDAIGWPKEHRGKATQTPVEQADLTVIRRAGADERWAREQASIYREVAQRTPQNPTAARRAEWLERLADRLHG